MTDAERQDRKPVAILEVCSTAGELMQVHSHNLDLHVTAPGNLFNRYFTLPGLGKAPLGPKAQAAALAVAKKLESNRHSRKIAPLSLFVEREGFESVGMGTSTADALASAMIYARLAGIELSPTELGELLTGVERSDGLFHEGICLVEQSRGRLIRKWPTPRWKLLLLIPERRIATADVRPYSTRFQDIYDDIYRTTQGDFGEEDLLHCIDRSALANATLRNYELYFAVKKLTSGFPVAATGIAHTGSLVYLVFRETSAFEDCKARLCQTIYTAFPSMRLRVAEFTSRNWHWN